MARSVYSEITPEMEALANLCVKNGKIDPELYAKYDVSAACATLTATAF